MVSFKLVIGTKTGVCVQKELQEPGSRVFLGKKIGEVVKGDELGLPELAGYEFLITGGSDDCGFPMRADVAGVGRRRILAVAGVGVKKVGKGIRIRKTVCGNTIHPKISQINLKVTKEGSKPLFVAGAGETAKAEKEKSAEAEKQEKPAKQ
ncbi:MAG: S6e family ribosomal protein [Candidatus Woesearchaeota archaeon]